MLAKNNQYIIMKDTLSVSLHPSCVIDHKPEFVLYNDLTLTNKNYIRTVLQIDPQWLFEIAPDYFDLDEFPDGD
jgi:pre-mRNA-splicing factor ATP-dependent RNA helicase DHX15/PRP43